PRLLRRRAQNLARLRRRRVGREVKLDGHVADELDRDRRAVGAREDPGAGDQTLDARRPRRHRRVGARSLVRIELEEEAGTRRDRARRRLRRRAHDRPLVVLRRVRAQERRSAALLAAVERGQEAVVENEALAVGPAAGADVHEGVGAGEPGVETGEERVHDLDALLAAAAQAPIAARPDQRATDGLDAEADDPHRNRATGEPEDRAAADWASWPTWRPAPGGWSARAVAATRRSSSAARMAQA